MESKPQDGKDSAGLILGVDPMLISTSTAINGLPRNDRNTGLHIEGFYKYNLTKNLLITPGFIWLTAPNNDARNRSIITPVIRATYTLLH